MGKIYETIEIEVSRGDEYLFRGIYDRDKVPEMVKVLKEAI